MPVFPNLGNLARRKAALVAALVGTACAPYLGGLAHEFVFDDLGQIVENVYLRNPARVRDLLLGRTLGDPTVVNGRRPLVLLTYFLDRALWGNRPAGYRLTNLAFHAACALGLYALAGRVRLPPAAAFSAAALFSLHPVLTEAVHAPAFRPDPMYTFFTLLYLRCATPAAGAGAPLPPGRLLAAWVALLLGLASKEAAVVAPVLAAVMWTCFPVCRPSRRSATALLAGSALLIAAWAGLGAGSGLQAATRDATSRALRFPLNVWTLPWLWCRWLGLLAWPWPLAVDRVVEPVAGPTRPEFLAGVAALAASVGLAAWSRRPWPDGAFGIAWMLAAFLPASNLVPLFNPLAERYLYLAAAGWGLFLSGALKMGAGTKTMRWARGAAALLSGVYLALGWARIGEWKDSATLWSRTLRREPRSARAHVWLGLEAKRQGRIGEALWHFEAAARLDPGEVSAWVNRAILFGQVGDLVEAERTLREAVRLRPDKALARWNLAVALELRGRRDEARREVEETLRREPGHLPALKAKARWFREEGRLLEAKACLERALWWDPQDVEAKEQLRLLADSGAPADQ